MQSRRMSLLESATNTVVGFVVSYLTWTIVARFFDTDLTAHDNLVITCIFTGVSFARSFVVRRVFNRLGER